MSWVRIGETSGYFTVDASTRARCNVGKGEEARDSATNSWRPVTSIFSMLFKLLGGSFYAFDVYSDVRQPFKYYFEDFFSVNGGGNPKSNKVIFRKGGSSGVGDTYFRQIRFFWSKSTPFKFIFSHFWSIFNIILYKSHFLTFVGGICLGSKWRTFRKGRVAPKIRKIFRQNNFLLGGVGGDPLGRKKRRTVL